ncbi:MAG: recombinase family protein [Solirubrobacteraceae bacterium]
MTEKKPAAVIYAAKSTEDKHGSIPTQIEDCQALAKRNDWEIVGTYQEESKTAYSGNRGDQLLRAREHAERVGGVIVVQHSDRLARGDGITADHLVELVLWARKSGVKWASDQDPQTFDVEGLVQAALMGDRNHEDSARKSKATRAGLQRRKESGAPVGPIPLGFTVDKSVVNAPRVIDPITATLVERIFALVEGGETFGGVARILNAEGIRTRPRGKATEGSIWASRTVRGIVHNAAYAGEKGYPELIKPGRWQAIQNGLRRLDPAAVQRRKGGRKPVNPSYWLRGTAFCLGCGSALYTRPQAVGRVYVCGHRRRGTGLCNANPIPAALIEGHVLDHLEAFVGDAEKWLTLQARKRDDGHRHLLDAVQRLRNDLDRLDRRRDLLVADYEAALAEGDTTARIILGIVAKLDTERETLVVQINDAEAVAAEWKDVDDSELGQAVDLLAALSDADTAEALNAALSRALAGIYVGMTDGKLRAEFQIAENLAPDRTAGVHLFQHAEAADLEGTRITFTQTGTKSFVYDHPVSSLISL